MPERIGWGIVVASDASQSEGIGMSNSRKANLVRGDSFCLHVAVWRVAAAIRANLEGAPAPTVTYEAPTHMSPWEDIVERFDDGRTTALQVKLGRLARNDLSNLLQTLLSTKSFESAVLVASTSSQVPKFGSLVGLQRALAQLRQGASFDPEDGSAWVKYLNETCGSNVDLLARRLDIQLFEDADAALDKADEELQRVYDPSTVLSVRAELFKTVSLGVGAAFSPQKLREGCLQKFEPRLLPSLPQPHAHARGQYLDALQHVLTNRRILRDLSIGDVMLSEVWTPLRLTTPSGEDFDADNLTERLRPDGTYLILAPVGAGKTEILARVALQLAAIASSNSSAPLPLFIRASDADPLSNEGLAAAAGRAAMGTAEPVLRLLDASAKCWVLLIDGIDETQCGAELVDAIRHRFPGAAVVVASRPIGSSWATCNQVFTVESWCPTDGQRFADAYAAKNPASAGVLRELATLAPDLLTRPLSATLAALVVSDRKSIPRNRTLLFRSAIPKLVELWAGRRSVTTRWEAISEDLRRMALRFVQSGGTAIDRGELENIARRVAPDRSEALIQAAQVDFGLLTQYGGWYEFLLRGIAEYLAGEALAKEESALVNAACAAWGIEPVRHALALLAEDEPDRQHRVLLELVRMARRQPRGNLGALRALVTAVCSASDTAEVPEPLASELAEVCYEVVTNEESPWRADRMIDPVNELAVRGGTCWNLLQARIVEALTDPRDPRDYYRAQNDWSIEQWREALLHCDPDVRCVAVRHLAQHVNEPEITSILVNMLLDTPALPFWGEAPAIEAGLALRHAVRGGPIDAHLDFLRALSSAPRQLARAAAAVALHPSEQDVKILAQALYDGGGGNYVPDEIVQQLGGTLQGVEALDTCWPGWRSYRQRSDTFGEPDGTEPPPPSRLTRFRLVRASRSAFARDPEFATELVASQNVIARGALFEAMCEAGLRCSAILVDHLFALPPNRFPQLSSGAEDNLALVLAREPAVRDALLTKWQEFLQGHPSSRMQFPGRALEGLVVNGDNAAISVYAEWLPSSIYLCGLFRVPPPDPRVLERTQIRDVAARQIEQVWTFTTEGIVEPNGERKFLARGAAVSVLEMLGAIWRRDADIIRGMFGWLSSDDSDARSAALRGLQVAELDDAQQRTLAALIGGILKSTNDIDQFWVAPHALRTATKQRLLRALRVDIERLVSENAPSAIAAACALQGLLTSEEASALIGRVVKRNFEVSEFDDIDLEQFRALVSREPDMWAEAILRHVKTRGSVDLGLIVPVFEMLPVRQKLVVAKQLHELINAQVLPWCSHRLDNDSYRPIDLVERFLFDAGAV